jgi:hypothetical protein
MRSIKHIGLTFTCSRGNHYYCFRKDKSCLHVYENRCVNILLAEECEGINISRHLEIKPDEFKEKLHEAIEHITNNFTRESNFKLVLSGLDYEVIPVNIKTYYCEETKSVIAENYMIFSNVDLLEYSTVETEEVGNFDDANSLLITTISTFFNEFSIDE